MLKPTVDWSGGCEDSCGSTGQGRPRRSAATRRLPGTPAESEAPGTEINRQSSKLYIKRFCNGEKYSSLYKLKVFFHEKRIKSKKE
jgi:hypothetical protein